MIEEERFANIVLVRTLQDSGAIVEQVDYGDDALVILQKHDFDLVILEVTLSNSLGYDVMRRIRAARIETPVVMLSTMIRPQARVRAFAIGADDFITKPYGVSECIARMQAIIRRSKGVNVTTLRAGNLQLRLDSRSVSVDGRPIHLTGKEYTILELLLMRNGMVITNGAFLNHLYGGMDEPELKIIDVLICKLRKKLTDAGAGNVIGTVWGRGYTIRNKTDGADDKLQGKPFQDGHKSMLKTAC